MLKLTNRQMIVISAAAASADGTVTFPEGMNRGVARKIASTLIVRKLLREVRARPGIPVWREDDRGRKKSLLITREGRDIVGLADNAKDIQFPPMAPERPDGKAAPGLVVSMASPATVPKPGNRRNKQLAESGGTPIANVGAIGQDATVASLPDLPRPGSKQAGLVDMLSRVGGATIIAIASSMGWLPHTTRAALTDLRRRGFSIARTPRDRLPSLYSIAVAAPKPRGKLRRWSPRSPRLSPNRWGAGNERERAGG